MTRLYSIPTPGQLRVRRRLLSSYYKYQLRFIGLDAGTVEICVICSDVIYSDEERVRWFHRHHRVMCLDCFKALKGLLWERWGMVIRGGVVDYPDDAPLSIEMDVFD